jgi:hypothetical protein
VTSTEFVADSQLFIKNKVGNGSDIFAKKILPSLKLVKVVNPKSIPE